MRAIALDIETTGLNPLEGHKIIEIGCVELLNNFPTGKTWQAYINPNRNIPQEAYEVHRLTEDFLKDKPIFKDITESFKNYIKNAKLIIHNAKFDIKFLNYELEAIKLEPINSEIIDTLDIARKLFPGQSVSLDSLCKRYRIDTEKRKFHGALLDAELLAEVYLEMQGGRQQGMNLELKERSNDKKIDLANIKYSKKIYKLKKEEIKSYNKLLEIIKNS